MWKLWNKLFGWDYVSFQYGFSQIVRRVKAAPNELRYVTAYGEIIYIEPNGKMVGRYGKYVPLTWRKENEAN